MEKTKYYIGADYIHGKGWGTYCIFDGSNVIKVDRLKCKSIVEFKSKLRSIGISLNGNVEILLEE